MVDSSGTGTFVCQLNIGRGIGTEICGLESGFLFDDILIGSDTIMKYMVIYGIFLDITDTVIYSFVCNNTPSSDVYAPGHF